MFLWFFSCSNCFLLFLLDIYKKLTTTSIYHNLWSSVCLVKYIMGTHEDTDLQIHLFEPSSERGTFPNWAKYGDIPPTHGDIPVVFCLIYEIGFQARVFSKFLPTGSIILVAPSFEDAGFTTCTFFMFGFSLDAKKLSIVGCNVIQLFSYYSPLPVSWIYKHAIQFRCPMTVSYTHLTLPTIYSV